MNTRTTDLRYPIGKFNKPDFISKELLQQWIKEIAAFPDSISSAVKNLDEAQLDTTYRPEGWTIRQVVHHCADSHSNAIIRFKLALTEENPTIKPYAEDRWARLADSKSLAVEDSLLQLRGLHNRWVILLNSLSEEDWSRGFIHPEHNKIVLLKESVGQYAWHSNHHLAHITYLKERMGW